MAKKKKHSGQDRNKGNKNTHKDNQSHYGYNQRGPNYNRPA